MRFSSSSQRSPILWCVQACTCQRARERACEREKVSEWKREKERGKERKREREREREREKRKTGRGVPSGSVRELWLELHMRDISCSPSPRRQISTGDKLRCIRQNDKQHQRQVYKLSKVYKVRRIRREAKLHRHLVYKVTCINGKARATTPRGVFVLAN